MGLDLAAVNRLRNDSTDGEFEVLVGATYRKRVPEQGRGHREIRDIRDVPANRSVRSIELLSHPPGFLTGKWLPSTPPGACMW